MKNTQIEKVCEKCGTLFKVKAYRGDTARFCSKACWSTRNPSSPRNCAACGKTFNSRDKRSAFCSRRCAGVLRVGEKSGNWKGGKSSQTTRGKLRGELALWRKEVFRRDNYTCRDCGISGGSLHAHHIKPLAEFPELALDAENGKTLCVACHEKAHGRKLTTPAKFSKSCVDCGRETSGRSLRCRPCSIRHSWECGNHSRSNKTGVLPVA